MKRTGDFCHHVARFITKHPDGVLDDPTTLDTTSDVFDPPPSARNLLMFGFLLVSSAAAARFFRWHDDFDLI